MIDISNIITNIKEQEQLLEGINDPSIFKAVFLAGGPGSGKSFIVGKTGLIQYGMKIVNPDPMFEKGLKSAGLDKNNPDDIWSDKGQKLRGKAQDLSTRQQGLYLAGRLGIVIDGTGKDDVKIIKHKNILESLGYECAMIYVNTNLETALQRDLDRDRTLGAAKIAPMWKSVQDNIGKFQSAFKKHMHVVDNSEGADWDRDAMRAFKLIGRWASKKPTNPIARNWIAAHSTIRNPNKGQGMKENYFPPFHMDEDGKTPRYTLWELHYDMIRTTGNDACCEVAERWKKALAEMSSKGAIHMDDLDDVLVSHSFRFL